MGRDGATTFAAGVLVAVGLLAALGWFGSRARTWSTAVEAEAEVTLVEGRDDRCGTRPERDCTRFSATAVFVDDRGRQARVHLPAGQAWDHGRPVADATLAAGDRVVVAYAPGRPEEATFASRWAFLGWPSIGVVVALGVALLLWREG